MIHSNFKNNALLVAILASALSLVSVAHSDEQALKWSGTIELGLEQSDNVNTAEIENASSANDTALVIDLGVNADYAINGNTDLGFGYSYAGQHYLELDGFDLDLHLLHADLSREMGAVTLGADYYHAEAFLDGDGFLSFDRPSLYLGYLMGNSLYLRGAIEAQNKRFNDLPGRDSDNRGVNLDAYWYQDEGRRYLSIGLASDDENADDSAFSWNGEGLRLRFSQRFEVAGKPSRFKAEWRTENRDYDGVTASISEARDETRRKTSVALQMELTPGWSVSGKLQHTDNSSNLPGADYDELRAKVMVGWQF